MKVNNRRIELIIKGSKKEIIKESCKELMSFMCDLGTVTDLEEKRVEVTGLNFEDLCLTWLNELNEIIDIDNFIVKKINLKLKSSIFNKNYKIIADLYGETLNKTNKLRHNNLIIHPDISYNNNELKFYIN